MPSKTIYKDMVEKMTDFKIFEEAYLREKKEGGSSTTMETSSLVDGCAHAQMLLENSHKICADCGMVLNKDLEFVRDWRYYGSLDTKQDPNRCHYRKTEEPSIFKDVDKLGFSEKIILLADHLYKQVTGNSIYRGKSRRGIIFACIFHAYKENGTPHSCENLIPVFGIDRKNALNGLKFVNKKAPKNSAFRQSIISAEHIICEIMEKFNATTDQTDEVLQLYNDKIKDKSPDLNRRRPTSIAAGVVRYYILQRGNKIPITTFIEKVKLSELTINQIVKEIEAIVVPSP